MFSSFMYIKIILVNQLTALELNYFKKFQIRVPLKKYVFLAWHRNEIYSPVILTGPIIQYV